MFKVHLEKTSKTVKGTTYNYYYISQSYRNEEGKTRKNRIQRLGKLTSNEINMYKSKIAAFNSDSSINLKLEELKLVASKSYLDIAVLSSIFDKLFPKDIFGNDNHLKGISTLETLKILSISRCLDPVAKYKTVNWFRDSFLPNLMNVDSMAYNKNKIFRELTPIYQKRKIIQKHLVKLFQQNSASENEIYFFDATTSFFEGSCCDLSVPAMDKTHGFQNNVIMIFLVTNKNGSPLVWETFSGEKKEVKEFVKIAKRLCKDFNIDKATLCFDRGIASSDNFSFIEDDLDSYFISGLNSNQIRTVFDVLLFCKSTRKKLILGEQKTLNEKLIPIDGFRRFSDRTYYRDLGVIEKRRYVVAFNSEIHSAQNESRENRIQVCEKFINELNNEYENAKKNRELEPLKEKIKKHLSKNKLSKIIEYEIEPIKKLGQKHVFTTYRINYKINDELLKADKMLDGLFVHITNHVEMNNSRYTVTGHDIMKHYKDKNVIEQGFRHIKSVLDLRPMYVWLPEHVNAHIDICMTAFFINNFIESRLKPLNISLSHFYSLLEQYSKSSQMSTGNGVTVSLLKQPSLELQSALKALGCHHVIDNQVLRSYGLQC